MTGRIVLATMFAALSFVGGTVLVRADAPAPAATRPATGDLRAALMAKVGGMNAAKHGMFDEDVTSIVAPFFPPHATMADVDRTLAAQHFAPLHPFRGRSDHDGMVVYVSHTDLMTDMASTTRVVLDFEFGGGPDTMVLQSVTAHIRAASM